LRLWWSNPLEPLLARSNIFGVKEKERIMHRGLMNKGKMKTHTKGHKIKVGVSAHRKGDMHIKVGRKSSRKSHGSKKALLS
jgi:hypothetical protein